MCPDSKLLSAFYDGEVASPWKEKIEDHIGECPQCKTVIDGFSGQTEFLQSESEPESSSSYADVQMLIRHKSNIRSNSSTVLSFRAPVVPMAAAAAAVLAFFFGFLMAGTTGPSATYAEIPLAISEGWSVPPGDLVIPGEDLEAMLSMIEQSSGVLFNQETSMELPVNLSLARLGDSALVRTAAYGGNSH
ncbi:MULTISPECIES: zf-HC2 domain-containing protein [unclassified Oceanispirochaeta]|uniref:zf-HC2 domain-containing protein n=1 Tax=unclassified Oceanispirochaeta TaxID=2635722 RepID=UPI000E092B62|nr:MULTISPECIES: zf-HC2 domain-containing protein [unclassified Oceanispirochaeta]MBF9015902.1 zf-HC2 domain-containing protein [Oceanispirochaeta sp. M2]NPD72365.1 zf-HC2 domain-containing protein [Oceanispirochaeta sp. M1]RDG32136.1 zf-HC2 domain-containing protein [Oceanispirochaeta sp. M1]